MIQVLDEGVFDADEQPRGCFVGLNASLFDVEGSASARDFASEEVQEFGEDVSGFLAVTLQILLLKVELCLNSQVLSILDKVVDVEKLWNLICSHTI